MFDLEKTPSDRGFPVERAILISIAAHLVFFVLFLLAPRSAAIDPRHGILASLVPEESDEVKIPVQFREAPGPVRQNPRPSDFSDRDRRAGGGDPSRPRSDLPFAPVRPGIEGLSPGERRAPPAGLSASRSGSERSAEPESKKNDEGESEGALAFPPTGPGSSDRQGSRLAGLDSAIRQAAEAAVGADGEGGAGIPSPDGGFVDTGPLSFDTTWYDWGEYAAAMVRRIRLHWDVPLDLMYVGAKGKVTIRYFILADGRVEGARIVRPCEHPPFNNAALQAILKSSPFRPLPRDLLARSGKDREGVTVTFFYNLRPGREQEDQEGSR